MLLQKLEKLGRKKRDLITVVTVYTVCISLQVSVLISTERKVASKASINRQKRNFNLIYVLSWEIQDREMKTWKAKISEGLMTILVFLLPDLHLRVPFNIPNKQENKKTHFRTQSKQPENTRKNKKKRKIDHKPISFFLFFFPF